jgi:hypothetical protein
MRKAARLPITPAAQTPGDAAAGRPDSRTEPAAVGHTDAG